MVRFILHRVLQSILVVFGVLVIVFLMVHLVPGDPAQVLFGDAPVPKAQVEEVRHALGLDQPLPFQLARYLHGAARGDLGRSLKTDRPVASDLARAIPSTAELAIAAMALAVAGGVFFGIVSASSRNTWLDSGVSILALLGISFPTFWTGLLLIWLFSVRLEWFPITGQHSLRHLVLPAVTLGWYAGAILARLVRRNAGGPRPRLHPNCVGKGGHEAADPRLACLAQRTDSRHHRGQRAVRHALGRRRRRRNGLREGWRGPYAGPRDLAEGLSRSPRRGAHPGARIQLQQSARRSLLRLHRSARPLRVGTVAIALSRTQMQRGRWSRVVPFLQRLSPAAKLSLVIVFCLSLPLIAPRWLAPYDPTAVAPSEIFQPPSARHWLGTDQFGRDILSRLIYGARNSLTLGLVSVSLSVLISVPLGLAAGYYRGPLDAVTMRVVDIVMAFPGILLALVVIAILGPGLTNAMIAVGIGEAPAYTRVVRGSTLVVREQSYIEAARAIGTRDYRIIKDYVFPNVIQALIVIATVGFAVAIVIGSSLGFLGLGAQPPAAEWGTMVSDGRNYLRTEWWISAFPGATIGMVVLAINVLGDALRDILDPRLR